VTGDLLVRELADQMPGDRGTELPSTLSGKVDDMGIELRPGDVGMCMKVIAAALPHRLESVAECDLGGVVTEDVGATEVRFPRLEDRAEVEEGDGVGEETRSRSETAEEGTRTDPSRHPELPAPLTPIVLPGQAGRSSAVHLARTWCRLSEITLAGPAGPGVEEPVTAAHAVSIAVTFTWLGMVVAISFLEAPLKFRAPGVTVRLGLGIGRLVFRALNITEMVWAALLIVGLLIDGPPARVVVAGATAVAALLVQLVGVRPRLSRRSDRVLAGEDVPRSHAHYVYIGLEVVKVGALLVTGILLLGV